MCVHTHAYTYTYTHEHVHTHTQFVGLTFLKFKIEYGYRTHPPYGDEKGKWSSLSPPSSMTHWPRNGFQLIEWTWEQLKMETHCRLTTFPELNSKLEKHLRSIENTELLPSIN